MISSDWLHLVQRRSHRARVPKRTSAGSCDRHRSGHGGLRRCKAYSGRLDINLVRLGRHVAICGRWDD